MDSVRSGAFGHLFRPDNFIFGKFPRTADPPPQTQVHRSKRAQPPRPHVQAEPTLTLQLAVETQREGSVHFNESSCSTELRGQDPEGLVAPEVG